MNVEHSNKRPLTDEDDEDVSQKQPLKNKFINKSWKMGTSCSSVSYQ